MAAPPAIPPDPDIDWPKGYRRVLLQQGSAIVAIIGMVLVARYLDFISSAVSLVHVSIVALIVGGILSRSGKAGAAIGFTVVILLLGVGFGYPLLKVYAAPLGPIDHAIGVTSTADFALVVVDDFAALLRPEIDDEVIPGAAAEPVEASAGPLELSVAVVSLASLGALFSGVGGFISGRIARNRYFDGRFLKAKETVNRDPERLGREKGVYRDRPDGNARKTAGTSGSHDFGKNE